MRSNRFFGLFTALLIVSIVLTSGCVPESEKTMFQNLVSFTTTSPLNTMDISTQTNCMKPAYLP